MSMKAASDAKQNEEQRRIEKKKATLLLIIKHLIDYGYLETAQQLQGEANLTIGQHEVADNVDLFTIVQEWEDYYEMRFLKKPKLIRRCSSLDIKTVAGQNRELASNNAALPKIHKPGGGKRPPRPASEGDEPKKDGKPSREPKTARGLTSARRPGAEDNAGGASSDSGLLIQGVHQEERKTKKEEPLDFYAERLLKPLPDFGGNSELRELASSLTRDIWNESPDVRWSDVAAHERAKTLLQEAVVMPIKYPQLFTGLLAPWKGILLFGPPGTGKTMLAKAVATECRTTFFNISASSIVSKWRGDSEKLVRVLFELARYHAPSTIFLDEIDAILSQRSADGQEHEGSRRLKTELLIQMDGLTKNREAQVFVLAASNLPWDLDVALLRRLEKRIYVALPALEARTAIFQKHLSEDRAPGLAHGPLAEATDGYSGADVVLVCKEAAMIPLRKLMKKLEGCTMSEEEALKLKLDPVTQDDVMEALRATKSSSSRRLEDKYNKWVAEFGST
eukprot:CAMPEP_0114562548 /NCGR_PEP_ID=MMETSP0114-20121206/12591_1 /TAXON_ID=31324 /ORGANISM="Goniomonas sp, Strain m" /LENGTH=506 /DNA_ID=CAMNT_0001748247 /DNA_START=1 /DNA_END=1521 /DNA_ORIENTATION=-